MLGDNINCAAIRITGTLTESIKEAVLETNTGKLGMQDKVNKSLETVIELK
jgi:hypothetical protein